MVFTKVPSVQPVAESKAIAVSLGVPLLWQPTGSYTGDIVLAANIGRRAVGTLPVR